MFDVAVPLGTLVFRNALGQPFRFQTFLLSDAAVLDVPCVYAVTSFGGSEHVVLYIGQTERLGARFAAHHKSWSFQRHRATHISVLVERSHAQRLFLESSLVEHYQPLCND